MIAQLSKAITKLIFLDVALFVAAYFIPVITHLTGLPLYLMEPMRVMLFTFMCFSPNRKNVYFMAVMLPLFSYFVTGHPVIAKNVIMSIELLVNVVLFYKITDKGQNPFGACVVSIVISKVLYYGLKLLALFAGVLSTKLVDTTIFIQLIVTLIISLGLTIGYRRTTGI